MKLHKFFSPVEMSNGLTSIARVEKLLHLLQKEQWHANNVKVDTQCWSTVISILTAGDSVDGLRHFIKFGGLQYLGEWLQAAQRSNERVDHKPMEELQKLVLTALRKVPVDQGASSCGMQNIVEYLLSHGNLEIQQEAEKLRDAWQVFAEMNSELGKVGNGNCKKFKEGLYGAAARPTEDDEYPNSGSTCTPCRGVCYDYCTKSDTIDGKPQHSYSESSSSDRYCKFTSNGLKEQTGDGSSVDVEVSIHSSEGVDTTTRFLLRSENGIGMGMSPKPEDSEEIDAIQGRIARESSVKGSSTSEATADLTNKQSVVSGSLIDDKSCSHIINKGNQMTDALSISSTRNLEVCVKDNIIKQQPSKETSLCDASGSLQKAPVSFNGNPVNLDEICQHMRTSTANDFERDLNVNTHLKKCEENSMSSRKEVEMQLTYYTHDSLQVKQVVSKVKKKVDICKEASGISSSVGDLMCGAFVSTTSPFTRSRNDCLTEIGDGSSLCSGNDTFGSCFMKEETADETSGGNKKLCSEVNDPSQEICPLMPKADVSHEQSSLLETISEDHTVDHPTHIFSFDLNEDIQEEELRCTEQWDTPIISSGDLINLSVPIPTLATTRGPYLPKIPLQFEGQLGWKGSAATSAFRSASFCKATDKEKCSTIANNFSCNPSAYFGGIDLNASEAADVQNNHDALSSVQSSGKSVEACSKKERTLKFDLNCVSGSDDNCLDLLSDKITDGVLLSQSAGTRNVSLTPSASSRQSIGDLDLNACPSFGEEHDVDGKVLRTLPSKCEIVGNPACPIFGSAMHFILDDKLTAYQAHLGSVKDDSSYGHGRKDFQHPVHPFLLVRRDNLPSTEQIERVVPARPPLSYTQLPSLSCPAVPLSSLHTQGVLPCMVDLQGATMIPQNMFYPSMLSSLHGPMKLMDTAGPSTASSIHYARPGLDLNSGMTTFETGGRGANVKLPLTLANNSLVEEHLKSIHPMVISGPPMKRKEPECGWETCQTLLKHSRH